MGIAGGPNLNQDGLVFMYDVFDQDNSYKGEPTVNLATDSPSDVGGWGGYYSLVDSATKSFNLRVNDGGVGSAWKSFYWSVSSYIGQYITITANYTFGTQYNCNFQHITVGQGNTGPYPIHIAGSDEADRLTISSKTSQQITWSGVINATGIVGFTVWLADASAGAYTICNVSNVQIEAKSHKTPFINGTRSSTQGLLDITGTNQIDISNTSFDSNAQMYFDGTNDYAILDSSIGNLTTNPWTFSCWWKSNGAQAAYTSIISQGFTGGIASGGWSFKVKNHSGGNTLSFSYATAYETITNVETSAACNDGNWHNLIAVRSDSTVTMYMDGINVGSFSPGTSYSFGTGATTYIGYTPRDSAYIYGYLNSFTKYNRALSAQEILQNYNATKSRFGLK